MKTSQENVPETTSIEVTLDRSECCASGMCAAIAPEAFVVDPAGYAVVLDGAETTPLEKLLRAARTCPTMCISVLIDGEEADLFG